MLTSRSKSQEKPFKAKVLKEAELQKKVDKFFKNNPNQKSCLATTDGYVYADTPKKAKAASLRVRKLGVDLMRFTRVEKEAKKSTKKNK